MSNREFVAEIVVRKVDGGFEAQWSGEVELFGHGQSAPEALVDLAELLMDPPDSRLSLEQQKIEGAAWDALERAKCKLGSRTQLTKKTPHSQLWVGLSPPAAEPQLNEQGMAGVLRLDYSPM